MNANGKTRRNNIQRESDDTVGPELKAGDKAPDFDVVDGTLQSFTLDKTGETGSHFQRAAFARHTGMRHADQALQYRGRKLPNVKIFTISMDLPFAQKRYCDAFAVDNVKMLSDHRTGSFGSAYGTLIKEWRVESRAIFVVDGNNTIQHAEYVKEVAGHPNYEAALSKLGN